MIIGSKKAFHILEPPVSPVLSDSTHPIQILQHNAQTVSFIPLWKLDQLCPTESPARIEIIYVCLDGSH